MTDQNLKHSLNLMLTNYNRQLDENLAELWKGLFIKLDAELFRMACLKVMSENKFFPNASEIIEAYRFVKKKKEQAHFERLKADQKLLAVGQSYCYICNNTGYCGYIVADYGYEYVARCFCSHGRDLNKFTESQIQKDHRPEYREYYAERDKTAIKRGGNPFYLPTIKEVLKDDYAIFEAQRKEQYLSSKNLSDEEKLKILREFGRGA